MGESIDEGEGSGVLCASDLRTGGVVYGYLYSLNGRVDSKGRAGQSCEEMEVESYV